jgi:hypothetical protein
MRFLTKIGRCRKAKLGGADCRKAKLIGMSSGNNETMVYSGTKFMQKPWFYCETEGVAKDLF